MGLAEIEKKILKEAEAEAEKISQSAREEALRVENEARQRAEVLRQQIIAEAKIKAEELKKEILVPARLAAKSRLLEEKQKMLEEVFSGLSSEIREKKEIEVAKLLYG